MENDEGLRAVIYARVSTEEQEEGFSLEAQIDACRKFCELRKWRVVKIFKEVGSAKDIAKRGELKKAVELVKLGVADVLVAWDLDRVTRSLKDFLRLTDELEKTRNGEKFIGLATVTENLDLTTDFGVAFAQIKTIFAELERKAIARRTKLALKKAREEGKKIGWPRGKSRIPEWKREKIKELYGRGFTYREIAKELGISLDTVHRVLKT